MRVFLKTYGCQMNVRDCEVICGLLRTKNYELTANPDAADVIIFNTCSVRQHAEDKVWSEIGRLKSGSVPLRRNRNSYGGDRPLIGVVGCMAQNYKDEIFRRAPNVDFVVGPSDIQKIPEIIRKVKSQKSKVKSKDLFEIKIWETDSEIRPEYIYHTGHYEDKEHAYVVISEGCSNFCSYCVVPYVRGPLHSRNHSDILKEIEEAIDKGITKITLLGQNVNAYISNSKFKIQNSKLQSKIKNLNKEISFVDLLKMVNEIKGIKEFSFITSHPKDTLSDLFKAMADCDKLKKYLHLPVQSGSDRILKLMNRGYTREFYLGLAADYRKIVKNGILTTDVIVGFPTETEMDFQDTFDLVEGIQFDAAYIFKYSPRPKTEASKIADDVSKEEKEKRHRLILSLQKEISKKVKNKKSKVKSAIQNLKFLLLICIFYFFLLSFSLPAYALNIDKVKIYFLNADYKQAVSEAEKILVSSKDFSGLDELYYILGLSYLKEGNYLRAADIFEIILKDFKNSKFREEAEIGLADSYFLRGNFSQAKNYYQNFISTRPNSKFKPEVYSRLSKAETEKNNTNFYYSVQVGSFSNNINARNFAEELTQKAYPAFIEEIKNSEGKIIYRVKVGKLPRQKDAKELEKKLSKEGYPTKICP